jgi:hypothetical protein
MTGVEHTALKDKRVTTIVFHVIVPIWEPITPIMHIHNFTSHQFTTRFIANYYVVAVSSPVTGLSSVAITIWRTIQVHSASLILSVPIYPHSPHLSHKR